MTNVLASVVEFRDFLGSHVLFALGAMVITLDVSFHKGSMRMMEPGRPPGSRCA